MELVVATRNRGKLQEIKACFRGLDIRVIPVDEVVPGLQLPEDGNTFRENALKKARAAARSSGKLSLADDSGLEVKALGGEPGVRSARYAGQGATDEENNEKLLEELKGVRPADREAAFRCVMALVDPSTGREWVVEGSCRGIILEAPRGTEGFGYDPLFLIPELDKTFAELPMEEKNRISHRGRALEAVKAILREHFLTGRGAAG